MSRSLIELQARVYVTRKALGEKFGVAPKTIGEWTRRGILPTPLRLGRMRYYDWIEVESRLANLV